VTRKRKAKLLSGTANNFDLGPRWQAWLRDQVYRGPHAAKRIARDWSVSEGTAKLWLSGKRPTSEYIEEARRRWGWRFVQFLFAPPGVERQLDAELYQLKQRLARLERAIGDEDTALDSAENASLVAGDSELCAAPSGSLEKSPAEAVSRRVSARRRA
jgi:hypothetical protein